MRRTVMPFLVTLAALCAPAARADEIPAVYLSEGELNFVGLLGSDANQRLFALYDKQEKKPTVLSIRSRGGPVGPGMELGRWIRAHNLDVKVLEYCMSSCANYVFPAGNHKVVSNFAVIGLHGGPASGEFKFDAETQKMFDAMPPAQRSAMLDGFRATIKADGQKEQAYLKELGVRADYTTLGQRARYQRSDRPDSVAGWTYSLEDFARLGVRDISVINPPWKPGSALKTISFEVLKLAD
jgi:hypothetical protein